MTLGIPKVLGHIWVGHRPAPTEWLDSWKAYHPDWEYRLYDNEFLFSRRWRNQALINTFFARGEYCGVSDLMRYEILLEHGGFIPEADSICVRNTDELWDKPSLYTVWENEETRAGLVSPYLASQPGHPYLERTIIRAKRQNSPNRLRPAWRSVGNRFLKIMMQRVPPKNLTIFPSHYFIPKHKNAERYQGDGPVYCDQIWGSTLGRYEEPPAHVDVDALRKEYMTRLEAHMPEKWREAVA